MNYHNLRASDILGGICSMGDGVDINYYIWCMDFITVLLYYPWEVIYFIFQQLFTSFFLCFLHNNEMNVYDEFIAVFMPCLCTCGDIVRIGKSNRFGRGGWTNYIKGELLYWGFTVVYRLRGSDFFHIMTFNLFLA